MKLSKSFTPLEVSCGSAGVVALASDGKVHCLFVDRTHNAKVSAHFAVVEELHDIVMCQVTCGSSVLMLSQQDGEGMNKKGSWLFLRVKTVFSVLHFFLVDS